MNDEQILELQLQGKTYHEITEITGLTYDQVKHALSRARRKIHIEYEDKRPEPTAKDIENLYDALKGYDEALATTDTKQTSTTLEIKDTKPIGIAFWGDWHLVAQGMNFKQFDQDRQAIEETEGLYAIGMGDYKDNYKPGMGRVSSGMLEQLSRPGTQDLIVKKIIQDTADKWLALIAGCHDHWDKQTSDIDFMSTLCGIAGCVNLWHGGKIVVRIGDEEYTIFARHKYKNESGLNTTNTQRNMVNEFGPADIYAVAHKHFCEVHPTTRMKKEVVYIRSGSYKTYDEYGQKLAGHEAQWGVPMCVLYPKEHRVIPFRNLYDGIRFLEVERRA